MEPNWTTEFFIQKQLEDPDIRSFTSLRTELINKPKWEDISRLSPVVKTLWSQWDRMFIEDGLLKRKWENNDGTEITYQVVLPSDLREDAMKAHDHIKGRATVVS